MIRSGWTTVIRSESMAPVLVPGDRLEVARVDPDELRAGDIIVFLDSDGTAARAVAHRLIATTGNRMERRYWTKGDGSFRLDPPLEAGGILGRVEALCTYGRRWERAGSRTRRLGIVVAGIMPILVRFEVAAVKALDFAFGFRRRFLLGSAIDAVGALSVILNGRRWLVRLCWRDSGGVKAFDEEASPAGFFGILSCDAAWSGDIRIGGDVIVPTGVSLRIAKGSALSFSATSEWSGRPYPNERRLCRLIVHGELRVEGKPDEKVRVGGGSPWAGLLVLPGASVLFSDCDVSLGKDAVLDALGGRVVMTGCRIDGGAVGVRLQPGARAELSSCRLAGSGVALSAAPGSYLEASDCEFERNVTGIEADSAEMNIVGSTFRDNVRTGLSATGGGTRISSSRFERNDESLLVDGGLVMDGCAIDGGEVGVRLRSNARAELSSCRMTGAGVAISAEAGSSLKADGCEFERNETGIEAESADIAIGGSSFRDNERAGFRMTGGRAKISAPLFERNGVGLFVDRDGRASVAGGGSSGNTVGAVCNGGELTVVRWRSSEDREAGFDFHAADCRIEDVLVSGARCGLRIDGGSVRSRRLEVRECRVFGIEVVSGDLRAELADLRANREAGVAIRKGARAELNGCFSSGNRVGISCVGGEVDAYEWRSDSDVECAVDVPEGRCELDGAAILRSGISVGPRGRIRLRGGSIEGSSTHGIRVVGGGVRADLVAISRCAGAGLLGGDGAEVYLAGSRLSGNGHGVSMYGGRSRLERVSVRDSAGIGIDLNGGTHAIKLASFSGCPEPLHRSLGTKLEWDEEERRRPSAAREALVRVALATRDFAPLRPLYALLYSLPAAVVKTWARNDPAVLTLAAHRSWATGRWSPGTSDVDMIAIVEGLAAGAGWDWMRDFSCRCARWKEWLPHLGEVLVMSPEDYSSYQTLGGARGTVTAKQAMVLHGRPLPECSSAPSSVAAELDDALERAHAYTRLMRWHFSPIETPRRLVEFQAGKALRDLGIEAGDTRRGSGLRDAAARAIVDFDGRARGILGGCPEGEPGPAAVVCGPAADADVRHLMGMVDHLRARCGVGLAAVCVDDFYRSYFILRDEAMEAAGVAAALEQLEAYVSERKGGGTVPIVMSRSAWTLWTQLPYLEDPALGVDIASAPAGAPSVRRAGRAFRSSRRLYWSELRHGGPRLVPGDSAAMAERALASFRATWRYHTSRQSEQSPAYALHYAHSRTMGLRLLAERGIAAPMFDLDELAEAYGRIFPEEMESWRSLWDGAPQSLGSEAMGAHYRWIGRQLSSSARIPG